MIFHGMCRVRGPEGERVRGGVLGLGLLMGGAVFSFGHSCGCTKAEILAIKDDGVLPSQFKSIISVHVRTHFVQAQDV